MGTVEFIGIIATILGAFGALSGILSKRDSKISNDSEWKGVINTKLDMILGINENIERIDKELRENTNNITRIDESAKQAHKRIDKLEGVK